MPLLDHFHPPWKKQRPWEGFHSTWASAIAHQLNHGLLPLHYVAIPNVSLGARLEIDVATIEPEAAATSNGAATATTVWAPPRPALAGPIDFAHLDTFEIQIFNEEDSPRLAAAIEL